MMSLVLLAGLWSTNCIQTQVSPDLQGYAIDSYEFNERGDFRHRRNWYSDPACSLEKGVTEDEGKIELGKKLTGMFISGETFEADFTTHQGVDLGAISLKDQRTLKIARGFKGSSMRNTMLGLFDYVKSER